MRRMIGRLMLALASLAAPALAQPGGVTVFAAASLTDALGAAGKAYTARTGIPVRFSFAASSAVARQIEAGAKADLFVSADSEWMDHVAARGLIDPASRVDLLRGRLALVAPAASPLRLRIVRGFPLAAALGPRGRLAVGDPAYVPAGRYAEQALTRLGVWPSVRDRLVRADNVRVALAYVARGEAPVGIVYETDARADPRVRLIGLFPAASHAPIVYPAALTRTAGPEARRFLGYLRGPQAHAIFTRAGFRPGG